MKLRSFSTAFAMVLLLSIGIPPVAANNADGTEEEQTVRKPRASQKERDSRRKEIEAKRKAAAKVKLVDINSAPKEELKKLAGIGDAEADKIIAGRPYGSKAWLVSNKVIPQPIYDNIRDAIVAKQPFKTDAEVAAAYGKKK